MKRKIPVGLALALAVMACGDTTTPPEPIIAEFTLDIDGAVTETARGPAYFGSDEDENGEAMWALLLGADTSRHVVIAGKAGATRPGTGSYAITGTPSGSGWRLLHILSDGDELVGMFMGETGTVVITESSDEVVRGTIEFEAAGALGQTAGSLEVTGSFVAVPAR